MVSEAQKRAKKKWEQKNKERTLYISNRSAARSFIRNRATEDDLHDLAQMIDDKLKNFEKKF